MRSTHDEGAPRVQRLRGHARHAPVPFAELLRAARRRGCRPPARLPTRKEETSHDAKACALARRTRARVRARAARREDACADARQPSTALGGGVSGKNLSCEARSKMPFDLKRCVLAPTTIVLAPSTTAAAAACHLLGAWFTGAPGRCTQLAMRRRQQQMVKMPRRRQPCGSGSWAARRRGAAAPSQRRYSLTTLWRDDEDTR